MQEVKKVPHKKEWRFKRKRKEKQKDPTWDPSDNFPPPSISKAMQAAVTSPEKGSGRAADPEQGPGERMHCRLLRELEQCEWDLESFSYL